MSNLDDAIKQSAALRGQGKFKEAIDVVDQSLAAASSDDDLWVIANIQGLKAAEEGGMPEEAQRFAIEIRKTDPELPSIQKYK